MPDWICRECGKKTHGWAPTGGHDCPHCGGELSLIGEGAKNTDTPADKAPENK